MIPTRLFACTALLLTAMQAAGGNPSSSNAHADGPSQDDHAAWIELKTCNAMAVMPVEINGTQAGLVLDTGATDTCLNTSLIQQLKLAVHPSGKTAYGVGGVPVAIMAGQVSIKALGTPDGTWNGLGGERYFIPLPANGTAFGAGPLAGVIGMSDLAKENAIIDCYGMQLHREPAKFKAPAGHQTLKMCRLTSESDGFQWGVRATIAGKPCILMVDTAAQITAISGRFLDELGLKLGSDAQIGGAAANVAARIGTLPELRIGATTIEKPLVISIPRAKKSIMVDGEDIEIAGILGMEMLEASKAYFDCKNGLLYLSSGPLAQREKTAPLQDAVCALARKGDKECQCIMDQFAASGQWPKIGIRQSQSIVARAKTKNLYRVDAPEPSNDPSPSGKRSQEAIMALAKAGDVEAQALLADAQANQGRLYILPLQAAVLVKRAEDKGLVKPPSMDELFPQLLVQAIQALAKAGDDEAKKILASAAANGGRLSIDKTKGLAMIEKAKAKGLIK